MITDILTSNFFELFNVPVAYEVDLEKIQQRHRDLQKAVHPDKFVNASDLEKRISMQQTSLINEAFNTLQQPVARAIYLLKLKNVDLNLENETTMDMDFLMGQMEMREALSNVSSKDDPLFELEQFSRQIKDTMKNMMKSFSDSYENEKLDDAKEWIRKMQFMQKAKQEVDELSAKIEDELF
ncbi:MAG: Fe-S protein assembly co-chaperone HscB [Gammaproteobacteria bacterium]|nr:Fe-S protein assembly co-chaperone HscB [Gammaproteobacteria bacterium]